MIVMPAMPAAQEQVWHHLFTISARLPQGWTVVGGQMVHLHCAERGVAPHRTTVDADAVVDIRAQGREMLERFTGELQRLGFTSPGVSAEGHEHRWLNGDAQIDVLIPHGLSSPHLITGITGSPTVMTRGGEQALRRSEIVEVTVGDVVGTVPRPDLVGALVIKAAAMANAGTALGRHRADFALLATMIQPSDTLANVSTVDRRRLKHGIELARESAEAHQVPGWEIGLARLELAMTPEPSRDTPASSPFSRRT